MSKGLERCGPRPLQQFPEARIAGEVAAHDERIDEAPDQVGKIRIVSPSYRGSNRNVVRSGVSLEQGLEHSK